MKWPNLVKAACVLLSAALASLASSGLIKPPYLEIIVWLSGALAGAPVYVDRAFGYISVHPDSVIKIDGGKNG